MDHRVTLNIRDDQSEAAWAAVMRIYESMPGWLGALDLPRWYGTEDDFIFVLASVEPAGIVFEARMEPEQWEPWIKDLCIRMSTALGRPVHDVEV